jgi:ORF6N domain
MNNFIMGVANCDTSKTDLMAKASAVTAITEEKILNKIYYIRDHKVMLDEDLAELYAVETKQLKRQVRRNIDRFPDDFMFELTKDELENLRSQIGTSSWGGARYMPMAFTEQGVAMLSSVLSSARAIKVNIQIMRIYTRMREMLLTHKDVLLKLEQLERQTLQNTEDIQAVFDQLKQFLIPVEQAGRRWIGFRRSDEEQ